MTVIRTAFCLGFASISTGFSVVPLAQWALQKGFLGKSLLLEVVIGKWFVTQGVGVPNWRPAGGLAKGTQQA